MQFLAYHRHQRSNAKPTKEAKKERYPRHVECAHGGAGEIRQTNAGGFVANVHETFLLGRFTALLLLARLALRIACNSARAKLDRTRFALLRSRWSRKNGTA